MAKINSVLGPISPDDLGLTLAHEHIIAGYAGWECDALSRPYNREKIVSPPGGYSRKALNCYFAFDLTYNYLCYAP